MSLRELLSVLPADARRAATDLGVEIRSIAMLPFKAAFAFDAKEGIVWVTPGEEGSAWGAWAGIAGIVAARHALEICLSELCAVASERQCALPLYLASDSA